jgi:putative MATE family efflux protein
MGATDPSASAWRLMWRLTLPVLAEESLSLLVGYTNWWLAGHYLGTADHLAAMSLLAYILWLFNTLFATVSIGATALVARFSGAGDRAAAIRTTHQALLAGAVMALALTVPIWLAGPTLIALLQLRGEAADLVWQYVQIIIPVIPLMMLEQIAAACLRGAGDTVGGFAAKSVVNTVTMTVSPLCLLGFGSLPPLGWRGLALGTATGYVAGGILLGLMLSRGRAGLKIHRAGFVPDATLIRRLLRIGIPAGIDMLAVLTCHLIYVAIINSLGTAASAAHGLGLQIEAMSYLPGTAFQVAAATIAGQYLGAGQPNQARRGVLITCLTGCAILTCAACAFVFAGEWLAAFFTGDRSNPTAQHAARLLKIVAVSTPSLGLLAILTGGLRGAGDTRWPLLVTFVGLLGIRIPLAFLLARSETIVPGLGVTITGFGWGVDGAWWAMTTDVIVRSLLIAVRFFQGGWKNTAV